MIKDFQSDSIVNVTGYSDGFLLFKTLESISVAGYSIVSVEENLIEVARWIVKSSQFLLDVICCDAHKRLFVIELKVGDVLSKNAIHQLNLLLVNTTVHKSAFLSTEYRSIFGLFKSLAFDCDCDYPYISYNKEYPKVIDFLQTSYPLVTKPVFNRNITWFFVQTFKRKFKYCPNFYCLLLLGLSIFVLRGKPSKRALVVENKTASDGLYALSNFGNCFDDIYSIRSPKVKLSFFNNDNKYLIFSSCFEQSLCAVIAISLKNFRNVYFSMPGGRISSQVLNFIRYETNTIHLAHGRISSEKFLVYTKYVLTEVFDLRYSDKLIRQKRVMFHEVIDLVDNNIVLFLHGYKKGAKYSFKNLYQDLKQIKFLTKNVDLLILRPHPTAFLLKKAVGILCFLGFGKIQLDSRTFFYYKVKEVFVSSPTYALKLSEKGVPFSWIGQ